MGNCITSEEANTFLSTKDSYCDNSRSANASKLENSFRSSSFSSSTPQTNCKINLNESNGSKSQHHQQQQQNQQQQLSSASKHSNKIVIALYNYRPNDDGDLSFRKGDRLQILDDRDIDWWLAKHLASGQQGYVPKNYVVSEIIEMEE